MFWKDCTVFLFLICLNLEPFFHFLGLSGLVLGLLSGSKTCLGPTYVDNQILFRCSAVSFCFYSAIFGTSFVFFWGPSELFVGLLGLFFGQGQFPKSFWNYLCRQQTLVLEILPDLFIYKSAKFGAFLHFLGLTVLFLGLRSCSRSFWHQL